MNTDYVSTLFLIQVVEKKDEQYKTVMAFITQKYWSGFLCLMHVILQRQQSYMHKYKPTYSTVVSSPNIHNPPV